MPIPCRVALAIYIVALVTMFLFEEHTWMWRVARWVMYGGAIAMLALWAALDIIKT